MNKEKDRMDGAYEFKDGAKIEICGEEMPELVDMSHEHNVIAFIMLGVVGLTGLAIALVAYFG